jgi:hypothetical protein
MVSPPETRRRSGTIPVMSEDEPVGVDVSLIDAMLALTVQERLELNDRTVRTVLELREALRAADEGVDGGSD